MRFWQKYFNSKFYLSALLLVFAVAMSAVISLSKSVENQSLLEQKSLTPVFDLVAQEILKPLFIAETIARASPLKLRMNDQVIDEKNILNKLDKISKEFNTDFFVASEKSRVQYNSDGTTLSLDTDKVEWYFRAKNVEQNIVGTLGNRQDISLYFDIKVYNDLGEFLGFIGVSKKLESFIQSFENVKNRFGYDFIFVDQNNDVVLSSDTSIVADGKRIMQLQQLPWYQAISPEQKLGQLPKDNLLVKVDGNDFLIARADIKALNWSLFLVNPLKARQNEATYQFIVQTFYIVFPLLFVLLIGRMILPYMQQEFANKHQKDPLTKLPNRANLSRRFKQMSQYGQQPGAIIVDIDYFKSVNDTHGHAAGDKVLQEVAKVLQAQLRSVDTICRWGGEEFVILLPSADLIVAYEVAERARIAISQHDFVVDDIELNISASFGVAMSNLSVGLNELVASADEALYHAKRRGRNKVCTTEDLQKDKYNVLSLA